MCHTNATPIPAATALSDEHLDALSRSLTLKQEAVLRHRWLELAPMLALAAGRHHNPSLTLGLWKQRHRVAVLLCLERGIPWASIRRWRLDDPRKDDALRDEGIAAAHDRRQSHLGLLRGRALPERKPRQRRSRSQKEQSGQLS